MKNSNMQPPNSKETSNFQIHPFTAPDLAISRLHSLGTGNWELGAFVACAVCGGIHSQSPLAEGMNWGIFTLMGFIGTVLAGIALFFVHIVRKEDAAHSNPSPPDRPREL